MDKIATPHCLLCWQRRHANPGKNINYYHFCPETLLTNGQKLRFAELRCQELQTNKPPSTLFFKPHLYYNFHTETIEIQPKSTIAAIICNTPNAYHIKVDVFHCDLMQSFDHKRHYYLGFYITNNGNNIVKIQSGENLSYVFNAYHTEIWPNYFYLN